MTAVNRIVSAKGAPLTGAQALRNDTPPASVAAARDFWLGAAAGGPYTELPGGMSDTTLRLFYQYQDDMPKRKPRGPVLERQ